MKVDDRDIIHSLKSNDWSRLRDLLERLGGVHDAFVRVAGIIQRCGAFVMPLADSGREVARDALIAEFRSFVANSVEAGDLHRLERLILESALIERGYRAIASSLASSKVMKLSAETRLMTMMANLSDIADRLQQAHEADVQSGRDVSWQHRRLPLADGARVYADGVISGIAGLALLVMQTDGRGWIDEGDVVVMPAIPASTPINLDDASDLIELAAGWKLVGQLHDRLRFFEGSIDVTDDPGNVTRIVSGPADIERLDYVANERFHERLQQTFVEMVAGTPLVQQSRGIEHPCPLEPRVFISPQEGHARVMLCEAFCSDITSYSGKPGGLTIMEWLRGYAVLQAIVEAGYVKGDPRTLMRAYHLDHLVSWLHHLGMGEDAARLFIDRATYRHGSVDLFDNPIIRRTDGSLVVIGGTVLNLDLTRVVLSAIASSGYQQDKKGIAFENVVRSFFESRGLVAKRLKFRCDDRDHEIDALIEWNDDIFVMECKNWSLSGHNAQRAWTFWTNTFEEVEKVKRKAVAVRNNPLLVKQRTGVDVRGKTITPVVLHRMPCAMAEAVNGVFVADWSAVTRFFQEPTLNVRLADVGDEIRIPLARQWAGEQPTVNEFKSALASPTPAVHAHARLGTTTHHFGMEDFNIEFGQLFKAESSFATMAAAYGLDPDEAARLREDGIREMRLRRTRREAD